MSDSAALEFIVDNQISRTFRSVDETLTDRTAIPASDLSRLIELCLKSTYFRFGDSFYEQVEGAAMGSPLSPIVANLYMEALEKQALETSPRRPNFWVRYVDDVFSIWPHDSRSLDEFLGHLNSQNPAIQFTMEKENDRKIAFLDVLVEKEGTSATTSIFRKKTHTDKYLNYNSHHHARIKSGIIKCLGTRARKVCHATRLTGENNHLRQVLQANGYPTQLVYRTLRNHPTPPSLPPTQTDTQAETTPKFLHHPYVKGISERIERKCKHLGIRTTLKSRETLRESLVRTKEPQPDRKRKGVVYEVPCADCECVYIGETGRTLEKRLSEHKGAVKRHDVKNGIAVHAWNEQHRVDWEAANCKVKQVETNYSKRRTVEAIHIHQQQKTSNLDCGRILSPVWHPLL